MPVVVGIHQLHYLPWLRYMHKIACADVFIVLDNIQYNKNGYQNRNRIKTPAGSQLLTVPVFERLGQPLDNVRIDNKRPWARKHARSIAQHYARAPHYPAHAAWLADVYGRRWDRLSDLNRVMLEAFLEQLGVDTPVVYASALDVPGVATERLVNLIKAVGGDTYLSGAHAVDSYLDAAAMADAGITLRRQQWIAPVYPQCSAPFVADLSILDLLLNCGPDARAVLEGAGT